MKQGIDKIDGYRYITTTFEIPEDKAFLETTINEATERSRKVDVHAPSGTVRSPTVRKNKNIGGLLAEKAFRIYVEDLIKTKGLKAKLIPVALREESVKEIGTQIDFILEVNGKKKTIEVRSSFSYLTDLPRLFGHAFTMVKVPFRL